MMLSPGNPNPNQPHTSNWERATYFGSSVLPFFTPISNMAAPILDHLVGPKASASITVAGSMVGNVAAVCSTLQGQSDYGQQQGSVQNELDITAEQLPQPGFWQRHANTLNITFQTLSFTFNSIAFGYNLSEEEQENTWPVVGCASAAIVFSMAMALAWKLQKERSENLRNWAANESNRQKQQLEQAFGYSVIRIRDLEVKNDSLFSRIKTLVATRDSISELNGNCRNYSSEIKDIKNTMHDIINRGEVSVDTRADISAQADDLETRISNFEVELTQRETEQYESTVEEASHISLVEPNLADSEPTPEKVSSETFSKRTPRR